MAILKNTKVEVLVNDQVAAEYHEYDDPKVKNRSPNTIVEDIEAVSGPKFLVKVRTRSNSPERVGSSLASRAYVDED